MRVTKTRLMRDKTINPNPPICRSKEPSFTFLTIYSCKTNEVLDRIQHYNWNLTQARAAADGGEGTYTQGYMYETAFKNYNDLTQNHCIGDNFLFYTFQHQGQAAGSLHAQTYSRKDQTYASAYLGEYWVGQDATEEDFQAKIISCEWDDRPSQHLHAQLLFRGNVVIDEIRRISPFLKDPPDTHRAVHRYKTCEES